ncbi:MAG: hypothetical protein SAJ11_22625, partial [Jaaginema sp. PMC 1078.18]|nr:hypothetical protein [Jaaginema sp. PMC 1078.18]
ANTVLSLSIILVTATSFARPDPIFSAVVNNAETLIPKGMVMRLPANVNFHGIRGKIQLYAEANSEPGAFRVNLQTEVGCQSRFCQMGYLGTFAEGYANSYLDNLLRTPLIGQAPITLREGVRGQYYHFDPGGASSLPYAVILWEQDNQKYIVSLPLILNESRQEIIDIAVSMANESPIP